MNENALKSLITARKRLKTGRERQQRELIPETDLFWSQLRDRLSGLADFPQFWNFAKCGQERIFKTCKDCGEVSEFVYQCSIKWCPRCNWKISRRRAELIKHWMPRIANPKHIVMTQRNFPILTRKKLKEHQQHLAKVRRTQVWKNVKGGCVSVEITNEGRGWHLHSHWLVDATFVDMKELSIVWGKLVGQEYGIVHFSDCSQTDYCNEVCKYVVKPGQMAEWEPEADFGIYNRGSRPQIFFCVRHPVQITEGNPLRNQPRQARANAL